MSSPMDPILNALGNVESGDLAARLRGVLAVEAEKQLLAEFRESRDPYLRPWAPVARGGKPLDDSGNLKGTRISVPTSDGIEVGFAAPYASYQQFGTGWRSRSIRDSAGRFRKGFKRPSMRRGGIHPREMLPMSRGLEGSTWEPAFERRTDQVMREALR